MDLRLWSLLVMALVDPFVIGFFVRLFPFLVRLTRTAVIDGDVSHIRTIPRDRGESAGRRAKPPRRRGRQICGRISR